LRAETDHDEPFGVELDPALLAELIEPSRGSRALVRSGERGRVIIGSSVAGQFGIDRSGLAGVSFATA